MRAFVLGAALMVAGAAAPPPAPSHPRAALGEPPPGGAGGGARRRRRPRGPRALTWPVIDQLAVGAAVASTFTGGATFDLRGVYRFVEGSREGPAIAGIVGLWGAAGGVGPDPRFTMGVPLAPAIGFGLAYSPLDKLAIRLNLAYSPFFAYGTETLGFIGGPPSTGIEAAYALSPGFEVTAGLNGNGDILGLAYHF